MKVPPEGKTPEKTAEEKKGPVPAPAKPGEPKLKASQFLKAKRVRPGSEGGFLAEARKVYGENARATFADWEARHKAYLQRPVR